MATMTNASVFLSMRSEEIKKVIYDFDIRGRKYSLVRVYIDGVLTQKVALNELGYNISTPSTIQFLEEIIEESK
jgi:hypothetical protein